VLYFAKDFGVEIWGGNLGWKIGVESYPTFTHWAGLWQAFSLNTNAVFIATERFITTQTTFYHDTNNVLSRPKQCFITTQRLHIGLGYGRLSALILMPFYRAEPHFYLIFFNKTTSVAA
jgi:hypothetical protein